MIAEKPFDGDGFNLVVGEGRGPVGVNVIHLIWLDTGVGYRIQHDAMSTTAVFRRKSDVERVTTHAVSDKLGNDPGTALPRELQFFDHQNSGPFTNNKSVAIQIEGTRCSHRLFVARGQRPHRGEATN